MRFYDSPDTHSRIVGRFIGDGLKQGATAVLIVTPDHRKRIEECLRQEAIDVDGLARSGELLTLDARATLNQFMLDDVPHPGLFRRTVGPLLTQARLRNDRRPMRAYGEMVDLLWKGGQESAAIRLETLWNQLARNVDFELLCGYAMGNFYKGSMRDETARLHTHVVAADDATVVRVPATEAGA